MVMADGLLVGAARRATPSRSSLTSLLPSRTRTLSRCLPRAVPYRRNGTCAPALTPLHNNKVMPRNTITPSPRPPLTLPLILHRSSIRTQRPPPRPSLPSRFTFVLLQLPDKTTPPFLITFRRSSPQCPPDTHPNPRSLGTTRLLNTQTLMSYGTLFTPQGMPFC